MRFRRRILLAEEEEFDVLGGDVLLDLETFGPRSAGVTCGLLKDSAIPL
jgi:hypothetical protein